MERKTRSAGAQARHERIHSTRVQLGGPGRHDFDHEQQNFGSLLISSLVIDEVFAEKCNVHGVVPINVVLNGRAAVKKFVVEMRYAFPDLSFTIADTVAWQNGSITCRYVAKGTHKRE